MKANTVTRLAAVLVTLAALAFAPVSAGAQELSPEHLQLAREFVDLTDKANTYEIEVIQVGIDVLRLLTQQNPEVAEAIAESVDTTIQAYAGRKNELFDQFARIYALRFTPEELEEINAFYRTEVGQKLAETSYDVGTDLDAVMQVFHVNLRDEFFSIVRADLREAGIEI
jgi:hypothetical protein